MPDNINRRSFMKLTSAGLTGVLFSGISCTEAIQNNTNVIIILADDLGYGDISGFGYKKSPYSTPNLESMADSGAKLTSFYSSAPYCAPSRATLLTGRYPFRNGVVYNPTPDVGINDIGLPDSEITLAEALKESGYKSCCIGKWHLGHTPEFLPRRQGFDEYYGILYSNDMRPVQLVENETVVEYPVVQANLTKKYTERAIRFIEKCNQQDQPFLLYLPHAMPHKPLAASEDFYTPETPDNLYEDVIRELDWSVGEINKKLEKLGIASNTLVVFTSDNGPWYGGSTGGLRGKKGRTWEGGLRVPFIASLPGKIPSGIVSDEIAGNIDIFPTVFKLAGSTPNPDVKLDGKDIWPLLTEKNAQSPHDAIFSMHNDRLMTLRSGKWKLHIIPPRAHRKPSPGWVDKRGPDGVTIIAPYEQSNPNHHPGIITGDRPVEMMLFDIHKDVSEQNDVSKQYPDVVKRLKRIYDEMMQDVPSYSPPEKFERLKRIKGGNLDYNPL